MVSMADTRRPGRYGGRRLIQQRWGTSDVRAVIASPTGEVISAPQAARPRANAARAACARWWFPASLAAVLAVHLAWLARFPQLYVDEGQNINWLLAWWHGTWATTSMDRLVYPS